MLLFNRLYSLLRHEKTYLELVLELVEVPLLELAELLLELLLELLRALLELQVCGKH
ncbi:MAG: hypothetical protein JSS12_06505 [Verrucomicrobia bacterium]|nr:hypothetical protein [Verrucomicrobiota bacterium]